MHTPDSSRFWVASSLEDRLARGDEPESLDKEPFRLALGAIGYRGDGPPPRLPDEVLLETERRYVAAYELLTGTPFVRGDYPVPTRLHASLEEAGIL
jgi:phosphoribosylaminoimidazole-succinocarboxamide synthase